MENREFTTIENAQNFALHLYGSIGLLRALTEAKDEEAILVAIADALLQHPEPAEA
jgi:hypothetical protein